MKSDTAGTTAIGFNNRPLQSLNTRTLFLLNVCSIYDIIRLFLMSLYTPEYIHNLSHSFVRKYIVACKRHKYYIADKLFIWL
jgi:hypothetical protein